MENRLKETRESLGLLKSELKAPSSLLLDLSEREDYFHDATVHSSEPAGLLLAESVEDIVAAVKFCKKSDIAITVRGAGTGLSGGCVASSNALVLSTELMQELDIDVPQAIAICSPGVITKDIQDAAAVCGLTYPPDPASYAESTLGGNVAENAGGLRCKKYGVTKDYVVGLEAILAGGVQISTGIFNDNRGFSIGDLLIGSEGTLAIITRIAVRLLPLPAHGTTILASFQTMTEAAKTVSAITAAGIIPTVLEFIDGDAVECSNQYEANEGLSTASAILLIETVAEAGKEQVEAITSICDANGVQFLKSELDPKKAEELWKVRRNLSHAVKAIASYAISEDVVVPNSRFPELVGFVSVMNSASPLRINSFGHAGDGNLHV
ncbi:MAG: FAD-binding protein, partial [candidate division Zixibacteria bacterium]